MTNEQIIFNERVSLMNRGLIGTTGRIIQMVDGDGQKKMLAEPEEIHTYAAWKSLGYQVQRGQKAISKISIWKHTTTKAKDESEEDRENMFMTVAAFFSASQVKPEGCES